MTYYPNSRPRTLSDSHRRMLFEGSGIDPGVARERGYYTARKRSEVPEAFKDYQKRPGLIMPVLTPSGERRVRLRPDRPRKGKDGRVRKYEQAGGVGCVLDVHPRNLKRLKDATVPLWVVEGEKKGDALTSRGECAIALPGVWNFQRSGEMLPDWDHVALSGRLVYVCFDSDAWSNGNVQMALERLVAALEERDAEVLVVHLEDKPDGSKVGADDFLVADGTVAELKMRARKFVPEDIGRIRLSKDEQLRAGVEDLERKFWSEEWKGQGGHSDRDVALKLIEAARRHGKVVDGGIRVVKSWGALELETKVSRRTLGKALDRLEERGFACRDNEGRKPDKSGAFVLSASVNQVGTTTGSGGNATPELQMCDPGGLHLRSPRLRWSSPKYTPKRGTVEGTRKVRQGPPPEPRPAIKRLGKVRGAILDALDAAGGTATFQEIADVLHRKRPRDIRRRNLPMLQEAGILTVEGDVVTLADNWLERVDEARQLGGELEAEELARRRLDIKRRAYHGRHKVPESSPTPAGLEAVRRSRELRSAYLASIAPDTTATVAEVSPLATAVRDYLERSPKDARQPAGWIGVVLWSEDLYPGKPTPAEMKAAIEELGGAKYLDEVLKRARGAA
jgi:Domain of unknown function (DUF3854)